MSVEDGRAYNPHKKPLLSCAECRRLKLKCSRVWPCTSCQKRGLSNLCPDGALATKPRLKQTQTVPHHVVEHIQLLQGRINQLERSLVSVTGNEAGLPPPPSFPSQPPEDRQMPYLQKKLIRKMALERSQMESGDPLSRDTAGTGTSASEESELEEVSVSLGTLKIGPDGRSVFFGPTAVTEGLSVDDVTDGEGPSSSSNLLRTQPIDIVALAQSFPFASASATITALQERAKTQLPPLERARELCATYFSYASFVIDTIPENACFESLFQRLYGVIRVEMRSPSSLPQELITGPQWHLVQYDELALFFCILALGALMDLSIEPFNSEADSYYNISRVLMTTENVLTEPTICSIQTLCLASYYEGLQSQRNSSRNCWAFMMLANKTAHIMGLHRDHSLLGLEEREMQKRRLVFWEVHSMDMIQSLALGRPICTPPNYMDTNMPIDTHAKADATGQSEESFYRWKYRFAAQVLTLVTDHVLRVKIPNYAATLETDRRIGQFSSTFGRTHTKNATPLVAAQLQMMLGTRETCILYIHRGFFAQAISTNPEAPEHGKYSKSVLRTFEGACIIIQGMQTFVSSHPKFAARIWFLWNHLLTATFVMASIAIRATRCSLSATSFKQLEVVDQIIKQTTIFGGRPKFMQPIVQSLRQKALNARMEVQTGYSSQEASPNNRTEENDELAVIGGKTRVLVTRQSSVSPRSGSNGSTASTPPQSHIRHVETIPTVETRHPDLRRNMQGIEPSQDVPLSHAGIVNDPGVPDQAMQYEQTYREYPTSTHVPLNGQGQPLYSPYNYRQHPQYNIPLSDSPSHYPYNHPDSQMLVPGREVYTATNDHSYPSQIIHPQVPLGDTGNSTTSPEPSSVEGSVYLWHAMLQDLGIGSM